MNINYSISQIDITDSLEAANRIIDEGWIYLDIKICPKTGNFIYILGKPACLDRYKESLDY